MESMAGEKTCMDVGSEKYLVKLWGNGAWSRTTRFDGTAVWASPEVGLLSGKGPNSRSQANSIKSGSTNEEVKSKKVTNSNEGEGGFKKSQRLFFANGNLP